MSPALITCVFELIIFLQIITKNTLMGHVTFWLRLIKNFILQWSLIDMFCSEWTFHHISHLRVRLQCDIAIKNPFSQKQSTICSIYIIICTVSCTKNYHTYFWHVWKYEIKIVYQCNRCVVYQTVLIQAVENLCFSVLELFITKKDKLRHVLRVSFWSAPLLELR